MSGLISYVREFGFPIAAFMMMFWLCVTTIAQNTKAIRGLEKTISQIFLNSMLEKWKKEQCQDSGK